MAAEPFDTIESAIKTLLEAEGLPVYPYEAQSIPQHPAATITPTVVIPSDVYQGPDQGFAIGQIDYTLRIYHRADKNAALAWDAAKASAVTVFDTLGEDRSMGGAVRSIDVTSTTFQAVITRVDGREELMVEISLLVVPKPV
jgi:hypothetical protein